MMRSLLILHHISIEIMGKEMAPEGWGQHFALIVATSIFLAFALYGFVTFVKKFLPSRTRASQPSRAA
jgi:hypothetical protein